MKKKICFFLVLAFTLFCEAIASDFDKWFVDRTLRVDYLFSGNSEAQEVSVGEIVSFNGWAGRRHSLSDLLLDGNAQVIVKDEKSGSVIYKQSFSSLMQEWLLTDEAKNVRKAFENPILLPYPKSSVIVQILFRKNDGTYEEKISHKINPDDILIRNIDGKNITKHEYIVHSGSPKECIDIVIVPEGYSKEEASLFAEDAEKACQYLFSHNPFDKMKYAFNVVRVDTFAVETGVSVPRKNLWKNSVFGSHFDTFYSDRYLTTSKMKNLHTILEGIPYEHIIILANSPEYGGGGIFNYYMLTSSRDSRFAPVLVHEFGHSFAGLGDEYFYEQDINLGLYDVNVEPWEPNLTTLVDFSKKWKDMLEKGVKIPTTDNKDGKVGVYEGGGYVFKGVYRPVFSDCRMRNNESLHFCPVCERAVINAIEFYYNK